MAEVVMEVSEAMAERLRPIRSWLPTVLELSLIGFKTPATQTVSEIITFLSSNPTPKEVLDYHASERSQTRLRELLALHQAGILSEDQQLELDELEKIEHVLIMLKAELATRLHEEDNAV